ncbi:MAG: cation:proton antiporter [Gammaproteobacteria bacterium]
MPLSEVVLIIMGLLTVAMIAAGICRNIPIPYTVFLVILGLILGWFARVNPHFELLLEFQLTPELVLFLFLPALIFESAFNLEARQLIKDLAPVMVLAIPALLISTAFIGIGLWLILGIDLMLCLLFGALISATDPVAVIALFKELGAPQRLTILVEGESLLNDATAIVLFNIILGLAVAGTMHISDAGFAVGEFFRVFLGGVLVGSLIGLILSEFLYRMRASLSTYLVMSIVLAYASFALAEHFLHVSGVMAVVSAAITLGIFGVSRMSQAATHLVKETWDVIALVCNSLLFLLVGLSVDISRLVSRTDVILVAIIIMLLARASTVYTMVPATIKLFKLPHVSLGERHIMWWGGLKGGLAIAIVLSIPLDMAGRSLLLDMTLGVVMFSLLINAPTIRPLIHKLGLDRLTGDERAELKHSLIQSEKHASNILQRLHITGLLSRSTKQLIEKKSSQVFASDEYEEEGAENIRHVYISALRTELDELKYLYERGLLQHYAYLNIKNNLQRDRELWLTNPEARTYKAVNGKPSIFLRIENTLIKRLREHDWAAGLLARYQYLRLSQSLQRDIAGVLISSTVIKMLEQNTEYPETQRAEVVAVYRKRFERRRERLNRIAVEFPEFYLRFETRLFAQVAFVTAGHSAEQARQHGEIGSKAYTQIERRVQDALTSLPPISDPAPKLKPSDLIGTVPLLNGLSDELLERLAKQAKAVTFLRDDIVIGEGEKGDALYIITHGIVSVFKGGDKSQSIAELRDGDFFGETALLGDHVRTATVKAKIPTTLLRLRRRDIMSLANTDPELRNRLKQVSEARQAETD